MGLNLLYWLGYQLEKPLLWYSTVSITFTSVFEYKQNFNFEVKEIFGCEEKEAVFGSFTYKSNTLGKTVTSPFSLLAKVKDGLITYFLFRGKYFCNGFYL